MNTTCSKLLLQLNKEKKKNIKSHFDQSRLQDIFNMITKVQPKNLMLTQYLSFIIEKGFVKNRNKLSALSKIYQQVKAINPSKSKKNSTQIQENKVDFNKFIKLLKETSSHFYPGDYTAYQTIFFDKITSIDNDDHQRLKLDQNIKKIITIETIQVLSEYQKQLEKIFEAYIPENYNSKLGFSSLEIKLLEKKLPIMCFIRFLNQAELFPQYISPTQFLQICSKMIPPINSNPKEIMFYYAQTFNTYARESLSLPTIKLLDGDIGLTFLEFQLIFVKLGIQYCRDNKLQASECLKKVMDYIKIKQINLQDSQQPILGKSVNKMLLTLSKRNNQQANKRIFNKFNMRKNESKQKIQDLMDVNDQKFDSELSKSQFDSTSISMSQIQSIRKNLDAQLPLLPPKKIIQKQNQGYYDINQKHVVIGQQLPKIQQKNKPMQKKQKKSEGNDLMGYKPQIEKPVQLSNEQFKNVIKRTRKQRINKEYPVILSEILYPQNMNNLILTMKSEIFLETVYINLGQRLYEKAYVNFRKAKGLNQIKTNQMEIFFDLLEAQIFQSAGKDQAALSLYYKAKQLCEGLPAHQIMLRGVVYMGLGSCLYHLEEYEYAFRSFLKSKQLRSKEIQYESVSNAIMLNNIGCCQMMLNRNNEAAAKFEASEKILDLKIGKFDQRTLIVQQNQSKNKKAYIQMLPSFQTMWRTYIQKTTQKISTKATNPKKSK